MIVYPCFCAKILALFPIPSKGHKNAMIAIAETLAERGHQVIVVSPYPHPTKMKNIHDIVLNELVDGLGPDHLNWFEMQKAQGPTLCLKMIAPMQKTAREMYQALMGNDEFRNLLEKRDVDLVFFDSIVGEFAYVISDHLKVPFVTQSSAPDPPYNVLVAMGGAMNYATVPSTASDVGNPRQMTFFQRLVNMLATETFKRMLKVAITDMLDEMVKQDFPDSRPIAEIMGETSLHFVNAHPTTSVMRPLPPTIIPIGASHIRTPKPLPTVKQ